MIASEAYDRFLIKAEENSTNDNVSTDKQRFAEIYNEAQIRFLEYIYDQKADDDIKYISSLLVLDENIKEPLKGREMYSFKLPSDYFDLSSAYALASQGDCKNKKMDLIHDIDDFNRPYFLSDEFTRPDFKYRESLMNIGGGNINVYYTDFTVDSVFLSYYRYPKKIQLQNPDNPESSLDDSYTLDFDERAINRIISAAVSALDVNNSSERWQLNNLFSKKEL